MKFTNKNIIKDDNPVLREKCEPYTLPLQSNEVEELEGLLEYVKNSIDEDLAKKYDLSAAVGIASPQVGIKKCGFAIFIEAEDSEESFEIIMVNPKIMAYSVETTYIDGGEACLSVVDEHNGLIHRPAYIKVKYVDIHGETKVEEFYDFLAVAIQHEMDHLNGILFYDHINQKNPNFVPKNSYPLS